MPPVTITIDLPDFGSQDDFRRAILDSAADRVLGVATFVDEDEDGRPVRRTSETEYNRLRVEATRLVQERVRALTLERIAGVVDEVLAAPFVPTNRYGERKGDPTTMREHVASLAREWLDEKVPDPNDSDRHKTVPRLQAVIHKAVADHYAANVRKEVDAALTDIRATFARQVREAFEKSVEQMLRR